MVLGALAGAGGLLLVAGVASYSSAQTPPVQAPLPAVVTGTVTDSLGTLYRPRFFVDGYAIHGDDSVPPYPVSHGCVRVSNEAINWIWANNIDPIGTTVWVY